MHSLGLKQLRSVRLRMCLASFNGFWMIDEFMLFGSCEETRSRGMRSTKHIVRETKINWRRSFQFLDILIGQADLFEGFDVALHYSGGRDFSLAEVLSISIRGLDTYDVRSCARRLWGRHMASKSGESVNTPTSQAGNQSGTYLVHDVR